MSYDTHNSNNNNNNNNSSSTKSMTIARQKPPRLSSPHSPLKKFSPSLSVLFFLFITSLSLSLSASTVNANSVADTFGVQALNYPGSVFDYVLFGSNYPQGNYNFTSSLATTSTSKYFPLVEDMDGDGSNEVWTLSSNAINVYDGSNMVLLDSYTFNSPDVVFSQPCVFNYNNDAYQELAVLTNNGTAGYYQLWMFNYYGEGIEWQKNYSFQIASGKTLTQGLFCGIDYSVDDTVYMITTDNHVQRLQVATNTLSTVTDFAPPTSTAVNYPVFGYGGRGMTAGKFTSTGNTNLFWIAQSGVTKYIIVSYDIKKADDGLYPFTSYTDDTFTSASGYSLYIAKIGSPSSESKLFVYWSIPTSSVDMLDIIDSSLTQVFSLSHSDNPASTPGTPLMVGDINKDGLNEYCICRAANFTCYDYTYNIILTKVMPNGTSSCNGYPAIGEYTDDNDDYMEFLNSYGVWNITSDANLSLIYDTPSAMKGSYQYVLPVTLRQSSDYLKDVLYFTNSTMYAFYSEGLPAVCGDGVCSSGESSFNCFADCGIPPGNISNVIGSFSNQHICTEDSQCLSGICEFNSCIGLAGGIACTSDAQCISGECDPALHVCATGDWVTNIQSFLDMFGVRGTLTKLLFGMIILIIMTFVLATAGYGTAGMIGGIVGGFLGFFIGLVIGTVVFGWIGVWFLFMFIFVMIVAVIVVFIVKSGV